MKILIPPPQTNRNSGKNQTDHIPVKSTNLIALKVELLLVDMS